MQAGQAGAILTAIFSMRKTIFLMLLLLAGCSGVPTIPGIGPYKIDIQQGNYVTQEMMARLKPGMTRSQVRFILGTPLVVDMFRTNRWDYVYVYEKGGRVTEQRKITVIFEDDKLARVEGDVVPAGAGDKAESAAAGADKSRPAASAAAPKPEPAAVAPAQRSPDPTTTAGEPVRAEAPKAEPARPEGTAEKPKEEKSKAEKPHEEKGFFGRMLDRIGF